MLESPLLTKAEAAAYLRLSMRSFEKNALPHLVRSGRCRLIGARRFFLREELDAWIDEQRPLVVERVGTSRGSAPSRHVSVPRGTVTPMSARAREHLARLTRPPRGKRS